MYRALAVPILALIAAAAFAQTVNDFKPGTETPSTAIPEIPAGDDPMNRKPDPARETPAEKAMPQPAVGMNGGPDCHVRRANTDTGFVVVCEENNGG
jgi:hypothetical protein